MRVTKLLFCQNGVLLGRSFWPKDSLVTFILLNYGYYDVQPSLKFIASTFIKYIGPIVTNNWDIETYRKKLEKKIVNTYSFFFYLSSDTLLEKEKSYIGEKKIVAVLTLFRT